MLWIILEKMSTVIYKIVIAKIIIIMSSKLYSKITTIEENKINNDKK